MAGNPAALRLPLGHLLIYGAQTALICLGSALLITLGVCGGRALGSSEVLFEFTGVHLDKLEAGGRRRLWKTEGAWHGYTEAS